MARVVYAQADLLSVVQPDLFVSDAREPAVPPLNPVAELQALLDKVQTASALPWPDAAAAMAEEHRALWLAREAGDEGARLATAIFNETERLFSATE